MPLGGKAAEAKQRVQERECLAAIEKCKTLRDLHPVARLGACRQMKIITLRQGDTFKLSHFPRVDFLLMIEGRLEAKWFNLADLEDRFSKFESEQLYIRDYLDQQRIVQLYP